MGLIVAIIAVVGIWYGVNRKSVEKETISIGFIGPLTGSGAAYGINPKKAMDLAVEEINSSGGINGKIISIIYEDDQANPATAVSAAHKLIDLDKVSVIFSITSASSLAITPITEKAKIILFSPAVAHPSYSEAGDYTFRNRPSITLEIQTISNFAKEKYRKAAILYTNKDPYPKIQEIFQKEFQQNNSEVAVIESAEAETKDFRTQLVKIKNTNPDVIFFALYSPKENGLAMKQARELSIKVPFLSMVAIQNPEFVQTSGGAGESVVYAAFVSSTSEDFISNYKAKYNEKPGLFAPEAYDAVKIIALGIKKCGIDSDCIKEYLYKIKDYPGVSGITTFDEKGDVSKPVEIKIVKNGQFVPYEK